MFEQPVSRVVFVQFYLAREIIQTIDDSMTQEAINFMANILQLLPSCPPQRTV
ncbi:MAG: hypothetical protein V7K92_12815 [Nostoc sp.]